MGDISHPNIHSHAQNCLRSCSCRHQVLPSTMASNPPFQRLLTFFARRSPKPHTITFLDSLRGDLSIGLNFPWHWCWLSRGTSSSATPASSRSPSTYPPSSLGDPSSADRGRLTLTREGGIHAGSW